MRGALLFNRVTRPHLDGIGRVRPAILTASPREAHVSLVSTVDSSQQDLDRLATLAEDTIRRDLRELAAEGLCQRVYGGALPVSPAAADYATRTSVAPLSKQKVAAAADVRID